MNRRSIIQLVMRATALSVALSASTQAQQQSVFKSHLTTGPIRKIIPADMSDFPYPDAVVVGGNTVTLHFEPGCRAYQELLSTPANDATVLSGVTPGNDAIVHVGEDGLRLYELEPVTNVLDQGTFKGTSAWEDALMVEPLDATGTGARGLVGIADGGNDIIVLTDVDNSTSESTIDLGGSVQAFEVLTLSYDSTDGDEIALVTSAGIKILETDGSSVLSYPYGNAGDKITYAPRLGANDHRDTLIALLDITGGFRVYTWDDSPYLDGPLFLGNLDVVGAMTADLNQDGGFDLIISGTNDHNYLELSQAKVSNPANDNYELLPGLYEQRQIANNASAPHAFNVTRPGAADMDGDGDVDILAGDQSGPLGGTSKLVIVRNGLVNHASLAPQVSWEDSLLVKPTAEQDGLLTLHVDMSANATNEDVQVVCWFQPTASSTLDPDAIANFILGYDADGVTITQTLDYDLNSGATKGIYHFEIRHVSNQPISVWSFSMDTIGLEALLLEYGNPMYIVPESEGSESGGGAGGLGSPPCPPPTCRDTCPPNNGG